MGRIKLSVVLILAAGTVAPQAVLALPMRGSGKPQDSVGRPGNPSSGTSYSPPPGPPPGPHHYHPFSDPDHYVQGNPEGSSAMGVSGTYVWNDPLRLSSMGSGVPGTNIQQHPTLGYSPPPGPPPGPYSPYHFSNPDHYVQGNPAQGSSAMGVSGTYVRNVPLSSMGSGVPGTNIQQHPTLGSTGQGMMGPRVPPAMSYVPPHHRIPRVPSPEMYVPHRPTQANTGVMGSSVPWTNTPHSPGHGVRGSSGTYHHNSFQGNQGNTGRMGHGIPGSSGTYDHHNPIQLEGNTGMSVPARDPFSDPYHYVPTQGGSTSSTGVTGMGVHGPYVPFSHPSPDQGRGVPSPPSHLPEDRRPSSPSSSPVVPSSQTGKKRRGRGRKVDTNDGKRRDYVCKKGCDPTEVTVAFNKKSGLDRHYATVHARVDREVHFCLH